MKGSDMMNMMKYAGTRVRVIRRWSSFVVGIYGGKNFVMIVSLVSEFEIAFLYTK